MPFLLLEGMLPGKRSEPDTVCWACNFQQTSHVFPMVFPGTLLKGKVQVFRGFIQAMPAVKQSTCDQSHEPFLEYCLLYA